MSESTSRHQDIRDAVRDLCAQFPNEYFRKIDEARAYPAEFVDALTKAGWMAALVPQEIEKWTNVLRLANVERQ